MNGYKSLVLTKKDTQLVIKDLRAKGYTVTKKDNFYECEVNNEIIFKAFIGTKGYLVRYKEELFTEQ